MNALINFSENIDIDSIKAKRSIMYDVLIALTPAAAFGCMLFGWRAFVLLAVCISVSVLSEFLYFKAAHKENTVGSLSAVVTGMLFGMSLSPAFPIWAAAVISAVAVILGKQIFLKKFSIPINTVIFARLLVNIFFSRQMNMYPHCLDRANELGLTFSPLACGTNYSFKELFFGIHPGGIGETSALLLILGGFYLRLRRVPAVTVSVSYIFSVLLLALIFRQSVSMQLFSGGLMLAAIFIAVNPDICSSTPKGKIIYGTGCGIFTFVFQTFTPRIDGIAISLLIMGLAAVQIDSLLLYKKLDINEKLKEKTVKYSKLFYAKAKILFGDAAAKCKKLFNTLKEKAKNLIKR